MDRYSLNIPIQKKMLWMLVFIIETRNIIENEKILKTQRLGLSDSYRKSLLRKQWDVYFKYRDFTLNIVILFLSQ